MENRDTVITLIEDTSDNEEEEHINITQNINREVNHRTIMKRKFPNKSKCDKKVCTFTIAGDIFPHVHEYYFSGGLFIDPVGSVIWMNSFNI